MLFQLYKKRDFGELISDTIGFFKIYWKNYGKNYLLINGILLILVGVIYYFVFKNFMPGLMTGNANAVDEYIRENRNVFLSMLGLLMIVGVVFYLFTIAFPIVYLRLVETTGKDEFNASEILDEIKKRLGRIFLFGLLSFFIMIPLMMIFMALSIALILFLIGIPLLIVGIPAMMVWMMQSLYIYLNNGVGYFDALGQGWRSVFDGFVPKVGSTIVIMIAVQVLVSVFAFIPMFSLVAADLSGANKEIMQLPPAMIALYIVSIIISHILYNLIYVHQGLIYYSSKESDEHINAYSEIDEIGKNV